MQLPSRLSTSTLGDLLGALYRQGTTGLLELCELRTPSGSTLPGRQHRIQLRAGLITAVDSPLPAPRLGEILAREGTARQEAIRRLAAHVAQAGGARGAFSAAPRKVGEVLLAAGLVTQEALERALRLQLRARLDALFGIEEAAICFHTARPLADALRRVGPLAPIDFLHGRPRARDRRAPPARVRPPRVDPPREAPPRADGSGARPDPRRAAPRPPVLDERRRGALRVLGLPEGASEQDIRRAFRRLAARHHPDRAHADPGAASQVRFADLSAAYHLLVA